MPWDVTRCAAVLRWRSIGKYGPSPRRHTPQQVYHSTCVGADDESDAEWRCPRHSCAEPGCDAAVAQACDRCPTGYCDTHAAAGMHATPPTQPARFQPRLRLGTPKPKPSKPLDQQRCYHVCVETTGVVRRVTRSWHAQPHSHTHTAIHTQPHTALCAHLTLVCAVGLVRDRL